MESNQLLKFGIESSLVIYKVPISLFGFIHSSLDAIVNNFWSWSAYRAVKFHIQKNKPDLVHFHGIFPYLSTSALCAAHDSGVPVVQTLHNGRWLCLEGGFYRGGDYCNSCVSLGGWQGVRHGCKHGILPSMMLHGSNLMGLAGGRLYRWVDRFIAVSDFIRMQHICAGFPSEKIIVKNNGIDIASLNKIPRKQCREGIVYVGRVSDAKGASIIPVLAAHSKAIIHVIGDGPDLGKLKRTCAESGFSHVRFLGKQPQERCFEIMASACCTIIPSQCGEAFPLVCVESMGLGTPVVASDLGGLGPLVRASGGGIVVNPKDSLAFVAATQTLFSQPEKVTSLGLRGSMYVSQNLNIHKNIQELVGIYESILDIRRQHAHQL